MEIKVPITFVRNLIDGFLILSTLGRLILALVKFCDFEIFRFSVYFNLANSWKISELEKMVPEWKVPCGTNFPVV